MIKNRERLIWVAIVLIAVTWKILWGGKDGSAADTEDTGRQRTTQTDRTRGGNRPDERSAARVPRDPDGLRKFAGHALSTPSRTERFKRVLAMLDEVTPENWRTVWAEYVRQTLGEGRVYEEEASLFMNHVGEIAGPDAMEYFSGQAQDQTTTNRRAVLQGWATGDPQGAHRWLTSQPADQQSFDFWQAVLNGATAKDPKMALRWLKDAPSPFVIPLVRGNVTCQIQAEGLEGTIKSLEEMTAATPAGTRQPEYLWYFYKELETRVKHMNWLSRSYPEINSPPPRLDGLAAVFGKMESVPHPPFIPPPPSR